VSGSIKFAVALPTGTNISQFLADTGVKTGVQKGIAQKLGVDASWVTVKLSVDASNRRLAQSRQLAEQKIKVDFTVTIPPGTTGVKSAATIETALKGTADTSSWKQALETGIKAEDGAFKTAAVTVSAVGHVTTTTTTKAPAASTSKAATSDPVASASANNARDSLPRAVVVAMAGVVACVGV